MNEECPNCGSPRRKRSRDGYWDGSVSEPYDLYECGSRVYDGGFVFTHHQCHLAERDREIAALKAEVERLKEEGHGNQDGRA